ncbi:keywimysin-related RiPP [Streptomyces sp. NPDC052396]
MQSNELMEGLELQAYEAPEMIECGSFQEDTGYFGLTGYESLFHFYDKLY